MVMTTGTFELVEGFENEYENMLRNELTRLMTNAKLGLSPKESNMIFQLKTHLGIDTNLLSQQIAKKEDAAADKDIGIESYN